MTHQLLRLDSLLGLLIQTIEGQLVEAVRSNLCIEMRSLWGLTLIGNIMN